MTSTDDVTESKILLAEYDCLKEEQKTRIGFRDNLLYCTLAAATAVVTVTVQSGQSRLLLSVPAICLVLGWTYLVNDEKISAIGCYVHDRLGPRLGELASAHGTVFGWPGSSCAVRSGSTSPDGPALHTRTTPQVHKDVGRTPLLRHRRTPRSTTYPATEQYAGPSSTEPVEPPRRCGDDRRDGRS
ncbi:hypothetical protein [Kitasatospora griseola]|uniref:hypothetical protein n=1 Tax=Kitasatospora griseola TaxID=2064 RepID=UPI0034459A76